VGLAAALLLGNLRNDVKGRIGLLIVVGGALIIVYNDPTSDAGLGRTKHQDGHCFSVSSLGEPTAVMCTPPLKHQAQRLG
jgi:hypothetical protein